MGGEAAPAPAGPDRGEPEPRVVLAGLPEAARRRVLEVAAQVLGMLPAEDVPAALRRVRDFAPVRRARAGAVPLAAALDSDTLFRSRVAQVWDDTGPDPASAGPGANGSDAAAGARETPGGGDGPPADEVPAHHADPDAPADPEAAATRAPVEAAVRAYLRRPPGWQQAVADAAGLLDARAGTAQADADRRAAEDGAAELRAELAGERAHSRLLSERLAEVEAELASARRSERRLRADADRARAAARQADSAAQEQVRAAEERTEQALHAAAEAERRAAVAEQAREDERRAAGQGRSLTSARARLLLDTVADAAAGLRRELGLPPAQLRPADLVAQTTSVASADQSADVVARGLASDDPATLDALLTLPWAHLVVDGYNVTKTGYGAASLADQRRRLVDGLAALAARTGAEVTCCFDGTDLPGRVPSASSRGVRVLFSAGESADELIRRLVRAEPPGRPVVVVSSDLEVVRGVQVVGARAVPAAALLRRLGRG